MQWFYILAAVVLRLVPHPWNVTPVGAMFLFSGATFRKRLASLAVPMAALLISDFVVVRVLYDGHPWFSPFTWLAFAGVGLVGWSLRNSITAGRVITASLAGSTLFFLVSNFGVWSGGQLYPLTFDGLMACYAAGLPFFRNTLAGDLAYAAAMFGTYALLRRKAAALQVKNT